MPLSFRLCLAGPSMAGKSSLILELMKHREIVFATKFERIVFATDENTFEDKKNYLEHLKEICPNVEIMPGLPNLLDLGLLFHPEQPKLIIMDDLADLIVTNKDIMNLFTVRHFLLNFAEKK